MSVLDEQGFTLPEPIYRLRFDAPVTKVLQDGVIKAGSGKSKPKPISKPEPKIEAETIDVSPDTHLVDKISEERALDADSDLLDEGRPTE